MTNRKPIFDAIRTWLSRGLTQEEVETIDDFLEGLKGPSINRKLLDPEAFYNGVRKVTKSLDQVQVDTINALLEHAGHWGIGWLAYGLATAWHEAYLKPIEEIGRGKGRSYGKPGPHGGQIPYGRGLVQLTWAQNYETMDQALGLGGALVKNYDLALRPDIAVRILIIGMQRGLFTGKSLGTYIGTQRATYPEFIQARRIINGTDRAVMIADYAIDFQDALVAGGWR